jgi:hypothetical protein
LPLGLLQIERAFSHPRCSRRRQEFEAEFFRNLQHARDVLLLLRTERADFPAKSSPIFILLPARRGVIS